MPNEKEKLEQANSAAVNAEAVERIKQEALAAETQKSEDAWFEHGLSVTFLDGKQYELKPIKLGNAQRLMRLLGTISIDVIILNFLDTGNPTEDEKRISDFFEAMQLTLSHYPEITREYLDEQCDIAIAKQVLEGAIGLNRIIKK